MGQRYKGGSTIWQFLKAIQNKVAAASGYKFHSAVCKIGPAELCVENTGESHCCFSPKAAQDSLSSYCLAAVRPVCCPSRSSWKRKSKWRNWPHKTGLKMEHNTFLSLYYLKSFISTADVKFLIQHTELFLQKTPQSRQIHTSKQDH